jgi:hypothetical protein
MMTFEVLLLVSLFLTSFPSSTALLLARLSAMRVLATVCGCCLPPPRMRNAARQSASPISASSLRLLGMPSYQFDAGDLMMAVRRLSTYPEPTLALATTQCILRISPNLASAGSELVASEAAAALLLLLDPLRHKLETIATALAALHRIGPSFVPPVRTRFRPTMCRELTTN